MRKLMWLTVGFAGACWLGACFNLEYWFLPLTAGFVFAAVGMLCLTQWRRQFRIGAVILLGCAVGTGWFWLFNRLYLSQAEALDGKTEAAQITISDYSWETDYGTAADGYVVLAGKKYRVRVYLKETQNLVPGDQVETDFRFQLTTGKSEEATYHRGEGIYLLAYQTKDAHYVYSDYLKAADLPAYLRLLLTNTIDRLYTQDAACFARALLLGDDTQLDYETDTALKVSGIRHIVAVSGLHITILFSVIAFLSGRRRYLMALVGIPVLILFAAVVGFTPSVTRACVMQIFMILALLVNREYDPPTALAFSALMMLMINPMVITSISFQLSVCCMTGIFLFSGRIRSWLLDEKRLGRFKTGKRRRKLIRWFCATVSVTLGATIMTTPLSAYYFGAVSLVGILTNLLTLWVVTLLFCGILLSCGVGLVWFTAGKGIAWIISWGIRYVLLVAKGLAAFPLAAVYTRSNAIVAWLIFCYGLLTGFLLLKNRRYPVLLGCGVVVSLCIALLVSWIQPLTGECRLTVLDVGQGQCILFQSEGKTYVVDCGGSFDNQASDAAAETLLSQGIARMDGLILTHYDKDHAGGVEGLLGRIPADQVFLPALSDRDGRKSGIQNRAGDGGISVTEDLRLSYGHTQITIFAPDNGKSGNESGLFVLFQTENCDILITGDNDTGAERALLHRTELPELEVLIVGHHGSKYSTCEELLAATRPEVAIVSVAAGNSYGHPTQETLDRLEKYGCAVYRTDLDGTVIYKG